MKFLAVPALFMAVSAPAFGCGYGSIEPTLICSINEAQGAAHEIILDQTHTVSLSGRYSGQKNFTAFSVEKGQLKYYLAPTAQGWKWQADLKFSETGGQQRAFTKTFAVEFPQTCNGEAEIFNSHDRVETSIGTVELYVKCSGKVEFIED